MLFKQISIYFIANFFILFYQLQHIKNVKNQSNYLNQLKVQNLRNYLKVFRIIIKKNLYLQFFLLNKQVEQFFFEQLQQIMEISNIQLNDQNENKHNFDSEITFNMENNFLQHEESEIRLSKKLYDKAQFITAMKALAEQNALYYCEKSKLYMIYDKIIEQNHFVAGKDLVNFSDALKEQNIQNFQKEVLLYKKYVRQEKNKGKDSVKSNDLFDYLDKSQYMGYLTDNIFELLKQTEQISLKKLQNFIQTLQMNFEENQSLMIPKQITLKKTQYYQNFQKQGYFEQQNQQQGKIWAQDIRKLKQTIAAYISDQVISTNVEKQMSNIQNKVAEINDIIIPELKYQVKDLNKKKKKLEDQLMGIYEQFDLKSNEIVEAKNYIMDLTEQVRSLKKELIQAKIMINSKEEENYELLGIGRQYEKQLEEEKQKKTIFFNSYSNLRNQYELFLETLKKQDEQRKTNDMKNMFPALSLKQQLEDAQFKIKKLKQQKTKLATDLQKNENSYAVKIQILERQLIDAKNQVNRTQQLKMTGISRLSQNFEAFRQTRKPIKNSMFQSVVSVFKQRADEKIDQKELQSSKKQKQKMSTLLHQADKELHQSIRKSYQKKFFELTDTGNKNKVKHLEEELNQTFNLQDRLQAFFYKESDQNEPKYNFCDLSIQQLRKRFSTGNLTIFEEINENGSSTLQQKQQEEKIPQIKCQTLFICSCDIISKSGSKFKKYILFNRKGVYLFDTKLRMQKQMPYQKILKIIFTYYNLDSFVMSFKRKQSPMKKKVINTDSDLVIKCPRTKQLIAFLSQPLFRQKLINQAKVRVIIQKQSNIWVRQSTEKDLVLASIGNYFNPFKINLSLKNYYNNMFYAELSRQAIFSRSYIIICIVEEFGVYCFQWDEDQMQKERRFIYLLPLVKRMVFIRQELSSMVKMIYEDWSDGKTFLLRFKNPKECLKFQTVCKDKIKTTMNVLESRKKMIQQTFLPEENILAG